ncbi:MAG TPA: hypothetical protein PKM88_13185 [bacterium]|nr:hypothetical protein [bacterium]
MAIGMLKETGTMTTDGVATAIAPGGFWLRLRLILLLLCCGWGACGAPAQGGDWREVVAVGTVAGLVGMPLLLLAAVWIWPRPAVAVRGRPRWRSNPLSLRDPQALFHTLAWCALAFTIGILISAVRDGMNALLAAALLAEITAGLFLGLRLCRRR